MIQNDELITLYNRFHQIHVLLDDGDRRSLQDSELTTSQYNLLMHLGTKGNGVLTITQLADYLICSRSNATRMVRRLEDQKLVQSMRDNKDRRLVLVSLTDAGTERFLKAQEFHRASVIRRFCKLSDNAHHTLDTFTRQMVEILETDLRQQEKSGFRERDNNKDE